MLVCCVDFRHVLLGYLLFTPLSLRDAHQKCRRTNSSCSSAIMTARCRCSLPCCQGASLWARGRLVPSVDHRSWVSCASLARVSPLRASPQPRCCRLLCVFAPDRALSRVVCTVCSTLERRGTSVLPVGSLESARCTRSSCGRCAEVLQMRFLSCQQTWSVG